MWAYGSTTDDGSFHSPAFTIEAERGEPVEITWINDLKDKSGAYLPHLLPVDPTLHWANPPGPIDTRPRPTATPAAYTGPVPIVTHVHGIEGGEDWSDGYPEAWYLPAASNIPAGYASHGTWYEFFRKKCGGAGWSPGQARYVYPNTQRPATLWLHDHALGVTRLNVYTGLVGFYLIRSADPADHPTVAGGKGPAVLPSGQYEIPLVIQDRSFNADGSLFYPDSRFFNDSYAGPYIPTCGVSPIWVPEFFGNCMMVNGKTWPYCSVEPRRYLLRILNGCNGRFLVLRFGDPRVELWQIGSDGGYLRAPAKLKQLLLSPAERADVIVDFSKVRPGARVTLRNHGPDGPYPGDDEDEAVDPRTTGQVMQFRVDQRLAAPDPTTHPAQLAMPNLAALQGGEERAIALLEASTLTADGKEIPVETTLGVVDAAIGLPKGVKPVAWHDPVSENPDAGATETWRCTISPRTLTLFISTTRFSRSRTGSVSIRDRGAEGKTASAATGRTRLEGHRDRHAGRSHAAPHEIRPGRSVRLALSPARARRQRDDASVPGRSAAGGSARITQPLHVRARFRSFGREQMRARKRSLNFVIPNAFCCCGK